MLHRHGPLLRNISQRKIQQLERSLVTGKRTPIFRHLPQRHIQRLYGVGRVDDLADFRRIPEQRDDSLPVCSP